MKQLFLIAFTAFAINISFSQQDVLYVSKIKGTILLGIQNPLALKQGDELKPNDQFTVMANSSFQAIDKNGHVYNHDKVGAYSYTNLVTHSKYKTDNLTKSYFKFVWKKISGQKDSKPVIAGVFRGDVKPLQPENNTVVTGFKISFKWEGSKSKTIIFIKNIETNEILKTAVFGNSFEVFTNSTFFKSGTQYQFAVSSQEFADTDNLSFFNFNYIPTKIYNELAYKKQSLVDTLRQLNYSKNEIANALYEYVN